MCYTWWVHIRTKLIVQTVLGLVIALTVWAGNPNNVIKPQGTYSDQFIQSKYIPKIYSSLNELLWRPIVEKYARQYGVDVKAMVATVRCESNFNPLAFNKNDPNGGSYGIAQFQQKTFYGNVKFENPDITDPIQQLETMAQMWAVGKAGHWSCYWKYLGKPAPWQ